MTHMNKEMKSQICLVGACAFLAIITGMVLRGFVSSGGESIKNTEEIATSDFRDRLNRVSSRTGAAHSVRKSPLQEALQRERSFVSMEDADFPALLEAEILSTKEPHMVFVIAQRWVKRDPDGFLEWLRAQQGTPLLREQGFYMDLSSEWFNEMAKSDPERAWKVAEELPGTFAQEHGRSAILMELLKSNPQKAMAIVEANRIDLSLDAGEFWWSNPLDGIALVNELLPGPARRDIIWNSVSSFLIRGGDSKFSEDSKTWFKELDPEAKVMAVRVAKQQKKHPALQALLETWESVDQE